MNGKDSGMKPTWLQRSQNSHIPRQHPLHPAVGELQQERAVFVDPFRHPDGLALLERHLTFLPSTLLRASHSFLAGS